MRSASVDDGILEPTADVNPGVSVIDLDGRLVENDRLNPVFLYKVAAQVLWWSIEDPPLGQGIDFFGTGLLMPGQDAPQVSISEESERHDSMLGSGTITLRIGVQPVPAQETRSPTSRSGSVARLVPPS